MQNIIRYLQAVAEMLVRNESRLRVPHNVTYLAHPRQLLLTLRITREVRPT